jgi:hypothetical protein
MHGMRVGDMDTSTRQVKILTYYLSQREFAYWEGEGTWRHIWTIRFRVALKRHVRLWAENTKADYWRIMTPDFEVQVSSETQASVLHEI